MLRMAEHLLFKITLFRVQHALYSKHVAKLNQQHCCMQYLLHIKRSRLCNTTVSISQECRQIDTKALTSYILDLDTRIFTVRELTNSLLSMTARFGCRLQTHNPLNLIVFAEVNGLLHLKDVDSKLSSS